MPWYSRWAEFSKALPFFVMVSACAIGCQFFSTKLAPRLRTFRQRDKHATFIHVQRGDPDHYATASPFALGPKLADRIVAAFDRKGKLEDDISTVLFSRERQMTHAEVKNRRHSHATVSKQLRAVEVHHDSPDFNEFLQRWGEDMRQFLPTSLGVTGVLYSAQPKDTMLPPHSDEEEGFVLHLEGTETWRICNKPDTRDHERLMRLYELLRDWKRPVHDLEDCDEFEMTPGDFLYIPEGCPYYAKNTGGRKAAHINFRPHFLRSCEDSKIGERRLYSTVVMTCNDYCSTFINGTKCVSACDAGDVCDCDDRADSQQHCKETWGSKVCTCSGAEVSSSEL